LQQQQIDRTLSLVRLGIPLESTDGERLSKCKDCQHPSLCINPYHVVLHVKELEVYLVNFINNTRLCSDDQTIEGDRCAMLRLEMSPTSIIPSVFSISELQQMTSSMCPSNAEIAPNQWLFALQIRLVMVGRQKRCSVPNVSDRC
jgi:hypothetical protein